MKKVDRRHGKRPLPSEASEEKARQRETHQQHELFPASAAAAVAYESSWPETELSAMVSALSQVIGTGEDNNNNNNPPSRPALNLVQSNPSSAPVKQEPPDPSLPVQGQGTQCHLPHNHLISFPLVFNFIPRFNFFIYVSILCF